MNKKKILIIEDDNILQKAIAISLTEAGFAIEQALDGDQGLELAKTVKPDLILLDLVLPKKSGVDVLKEIRGSETTNQVPVLVFTVYEKEEVIAECVTLGIQGYFFKSSYSLEDIIAEIKKNL